MQKLVRAALILSLLVASACSKGDPNAFETYLKKLEDTEERDLAMKELQRVVKGIASAPDGEVRKKEFGEKVIPVFEKIWDDAEAHRLDMLDMARDMAQAQAAGIWAKSIVLDGSGEARKAAVLALQGIREAKATASTDAVIEQLGALVENPTKDAQGDSAGKIRLELAKTLGVLGNKKAVPVLIEVIRQPAQKQPVQVHKEAVTALERLADPSSAEALLAVSFRVPDSPGTQSIGERSKRALAAIGEPAIPTVLSMLKGELESVNKLAASNGVDLQIVKQTAAGVLGAMGSSKGTEDLIAFMPRSDCNAGSSGKKSKSKKRRKKKKKSSAGEADPAAVSLRAFVANALGFIGDEAAVSSLCECRNATRNPGDLWEITTALGRIGGTKAFECLTDIVTKGEYDPEYLPNADFRHEIRWEGARLMILAAGVSETKKARKVWQSLNKNPRIKKEVAKWEPSLKLLETCKEDKECYLKTVSDTSADVFAREKAAFELARLAKGDETVAVAVAKAFKTRDPEARVTVALMVGRMMAGKSCLACANEISKVMKSEKGSADAKMQLAWLTARQTIAKISGNSGAGAGQ